MTRSPKKKPLKAINSQRDFAKSIGIATGTLSGYLKRDDFPVAKVAPWSKADVAAVQYWRTQLQEDRSREEGPTSSAGMDVQNLTPLSRAKLAVLVRRAERMRFDLEVLQGKYLSAEEVRRKKIAQILAIKHSLLLLPDHLPAELAGRSVPEISDILKRSIYAMLNTFVAGYFWITHEQAEAIVAGKPPAEWAEPLRQISDSAVEMIRGGIELAAQRASLNRDRIVTDPSRATVGSSTAPAQEPVAAAGC